MCLSTMIQHTVGAIMAYFHREWDWSNVRSFSQVQPLVLQVLKKFYMLMNVAFASSSFGYYLLLTGNIDFLSATIGSCVCFIAFISYGGWRQTEIRVFLLITGALFEGALLSPVHTGFLGIDIGNYLCAILGTSLVFSCFWAASKSTRRFDIFYLGGVTFSASVVLLWMFIASYALDFDSVYIYQIYAGVMLFMVYVAMYTQELVHKIHSGDTEYIEYAISFFTDAPAVCFHCGRLVSRDVREMGTRELCCLFRWQRPNQIQSNSSLCLLSHYYAY